MNLSSQQVKDKLHIGETKLHKLIEEGKLVTVNKPKEGATKFFRKFDSVAINKFYQEMKQNGIVGQDTKTKSKDLPELKEVSQNGILTRLTRIEEKLDRLLKIWS